MKLAEYIVGGSVRIVEAERPSLPTGGLVVKTEACGLCSGELMAWYLDRKAPHVLGHEVAGVIVESDDARFPIGERVFAHHHAPCMRCDLCARGAFVFCEQWRRTKLDPGGMAEFFGVSAEGLNDAFLVPGVDARNAALIEPLACVLKAIRRAECLDSDGTGCAIIGAGALGLMFGLMLPQATLLESNPARREYASSLGLNAVDQAVSEKFQTAFVCPGSGTAIALGYDLLAPDGKLVLFAPMSPSEPFPFPQEAAYFRDLQIIHSYSCGPDDTHAAFERIRQGRVKAEQVVSDFVHLDDLPQAYSQMRDGRILKAMVVFD